MDNPLHKHGRFFDVWSRFYRATPLGQALQALQKDGLRRLRPVAGQRILDLGCGPGDASNALRAHGVEVISADYSEGMIAQARGHGSLHGRLVRADAGRLPFADASFDKALCTNSFHHYPDHFASLRELRRVLKPGGLLVLLDPRKDQLFGRLAIEFFEREVFRLREVRVFTLHEWKALLRDAGFSAATVESGPVWNPAAWAEVFVEAVA